MGKSAPKAPDPYETAAAQTQSNLATAQAQQNLNMINQVGPQGSLTYDVVGTNPDGTSRYQQTTSLNPQAQAAYDAYQGNLTNINNAAGQALNNLSGMSLQSGPTSAYNANFGSGLNGFNSAFGSGTGMNTAFNGNLGTNANFSGDSGINANFNANSGINTTMNPLATTYAGADDFSADRQRVEDALWQRGAANRDQQEANLRATLASKGIREGTAAWNSEMNRLGAQNTDAQLATIAAAGNEQSRLVGLAQNAAQFGNQATLDQFNALNNAALSNAQFGQNAQQLSNNAALQNAQFGQSAQQAGNAALADQAQFGLAAQQAGNNASLQNAQFGQTAQQAQNAAALQQAQFGREGQQLTNAADLAAMQARNDAYGQQANVMGGLFGLGASAGQMPQFGATPQTGVNGTDISGLINSNYTNRTNQYNAGLGALGGLAGAAMGLF